MTQRTVVLVASPDDATRARVRLALGDERFEVHEVADTDSAIVAVATHLPAMLVLDVALPGAGALVLARSVRAQPQTAETRTLLLVGRGERPPGGTEGIDASVAIPASPFAILRRVDELLADG